MVKCQRTLFSSQREDCRRWRVLKNWWSFRRLQLNQETEHEADVGEEEVSNEEP